MHLLAPILPLLLPLLPLASAANWNYLGAPSGPLLWHTLHSPDSGVCGNGTHQSPIDVSHPVPIASSDVMTAYFLYPNFAHLAIKNNGHTIQLEPSVNDNFFLETHVSSQPMRRRWRLEQFHWHTPAEHTLGGKTFPAEVHFVHGLVEDGGRTKLVVGLFAGPTDCGQPAMWQSLCPPPGYGPGCPLDFVQYPDTQAMVYNFPFHEIISHVNTGANSFHLYAGSLTTPPCTEGITWLNFYRPTPIGVNVYRKIKEAEGFNARYLQNKVRGGTNLIEIIKGKGNGHSVEKPREGWANGATGGTGSVSKEELRAAGVGGEEILPVPEDEMGGEL